MSTNAKIIAAFIGGFACSRVVDALVVYHNTKVLEKNFQNPEYVENLVNNCVDQIFGSEE
jgi:hypothetical protein